MTNQTTEIKILEASNIDPEYLALCPYCDQPIMGGAVIVINREWGAMCLAHGDCAAGGEEE